MSCVALFTISSFLCGLAPNLSMLIFFRVLQGVGGGGLQPSEQAILADTFAPRKRGMAFAVYGMAVVLAPAIGPTLGGWITDNFNWRWIFFINIPVGIISLLLTNHADQRSALHEERTSAPDSRIDYIGLGLLALGLGAMQVVLDKGQRDDWFGSHFIVVMTAICVVSLIAVVIWEWRHKHPIIDLHLFRERSFAIGNMLMFMVGFALLSSTVLLPQFSQDIVGLHGAKGGPRLDARRYRDYFMHAARRLFCSATPTRAVCFYSGSHGARFRLFHMTQFRHRNRFPHRGDRTRLSSHGPRIPFRAYQHGRLRLHPARKKQCGFGTHQPRAEHRRQRRHFLRHHDARAARASASVESDGSAQSRKRPIPGR